MNKGRKSPESKQSPRGAMYEEMGIPPTASRSAKQAWAPFACGNNAMQSGKADRVTDPDDRNKRTHAAQ